MARPYRRDDHYYRQAKKQGLRARSAFKIEEIARRFRLLAPGRRVLDLGAAPGGFLQVLAVAVGPTGLAVGVDVVPIAPLARPQVRTAVLDALDPEFGRKVAEVEPGLFDLVTSDMAPKTTGVRITDEARSLALARVALDVARHRLRAGGAFVCKVFMGGDFPAFEKEVAAAFGKVKVVRPEATRGSSFEVYVVGTDLTPQPPSPKGSGLGG